MRKTIAAILLLLLAISAMNLYTGAEDVLASGEPARLTLLQAPLRANNDSHFFNLSVTMGFPGDGSPGNPFIISGYEINASGFGFGLYLGNLTHSIIIRNCWIHNTTSSFSFYYWGAGIALYNTYDTKVQDCLISDTRIGIILAQSRRITVNGTKVDNAQLEGIYAFGSENLIIRDNEVRGAMNGISVGSSSNMVLVTGNDLRYGGGTGIDISNRISSCNVTLNHILYYSDSGISVSDSDDTRLIENDVQGCNYGIYLDGYKIDRSSDRIMVLDNHVNDCDLGMLIGGTRWTLVDGNNVSYCHLYGIQVDIGSENTTLRNNDIWYSSDYGIYLRGRNHLVHNNTLNFNNRSVKVFNPAFIQAYDESMETNWSFQQKGNIWSDWRSPDDDLDGIVDLPYVLHTPIGMYSADPYPISDYVPPDLEPPSAPLSLIGDVGRLFVNISWSPPIDDGGSPITEYKVIRSQGFSTPLVIEELSSDVLYYNDTNLLEDTNYTYWVSAVNDIGEGPNSLPLRVATPVPLGVPYIEIVYPPNESILDYDNLTIRWNYSVANGTLDRIEIDVGSGWMDIGNATQYHLEGLSDGRYHIPVRILTKEGLAAQYNLMFNVSVPAPFIEIIAPVITQTNDDPIRFEWDYGSSGSIITLVEYRLDGGNWTDSSLSRLINIDGLVEGEHVFEVRVTDAGGRNAADSITVFIDRTPPGVLDYGPVGLDEPLDSIIYATFGEMVVDESLRIRMEPAVNGSITILNHSIVTFTPDEPLISGTEYIVHLQALDGTGNLLFPFSWSFRVEAQVVLTRVYGYVVDQEGNNIQGAVVTLGNLSMETNAFGQFEFLVSPGDYLLSVNRIGFREYSEHLMVSSTGEYNRGMVPLDPEQKDDDPDEETTIPWIPVLIFIFAGVVAIGYFTLKQQRSSGEFDIEE